MRRAADPAAVPRLLDRFLAASRAVRRGDCVLAAVSGGPDSLALLIALGGAAQPAGVTVIAAHVNHGLRGEAADADAAFVRETAAALGVPALVLRAGPRLATALRQGNAGGLEQAAREARYALLARAARRTGARVIFVAHTADDQAETVILNLCRGAGARGLGAMRAVARRDGIVIARPLLGATRDQIAAFLAAQGAEGRLDSTNDDQSRTRSWVRRRVLPVLAERHGPGVVLRLARTATLLREADRALRAAALRAEADVVVAPGTSSPGAIALDAGRLLARERAIQRYVVRSAIERLAGTLTGIESSHVDGVLGLARRAFGEANGSGRLAPRGRHERARSLPHGLRASLRGATVVIDREADDRRDSIAETPLCVHLSVPGRAALPGGGEIVARRRSRRAWPGPEPSNAPRAYFDASALAPPLAARAPRPGERLRPFGADGSKKLSDLLAEARVPRHERRGRLVVADDSGILWVPGIRRGDRAPVEAGTREIVEVTVRWPDPGQAAR